MTREEFLKEIARIADVDASKVEASISLEALGGWDSLAVVEFVGFADERFGRAVTFDQLERAGTVDDLIALVGGVEE